MTDQYPAAAEPSAQVAAVAKAQRFVLLGLLLNIVANVAVRAPSSATGVAVGLVIALACLAFTMYWVYQLCDALGSTPWIWMIAVIIPVVGFLCLAVLSQRATTLLKQHGVKVGFLGAKT